MYYIYENKAGEWVGRKYGLEGLHDKEDKVWLVKVIESDDYWERILKRLKNKYGEEKVKEHFDDICTLMYYDWKLNYNEDKIKDFLGIEIEEEDITENENDFTDNEEKDIYQILIQQEQTLSRLEKKLTKLEKIITMQNRKKK